MPPGYNMQDLPSVPKNILKLDIKKDNEKVLIMNTLKYELHIHSTHPM